MPFHLVLHLALQGTATGMQLVEVEEVAKVGVLAEIAILPSDEPQALIMTEATVSSVTELAVGAPGAALSPVPVLPIRLIMTLAMVNSVKSEGATNDVQASCSQERATSTMDSANGTSYTRRTVLAGIRTSSVMDVPSNDTYDMDNLTVLRVVFETQSVSNWESNWPICLLDFVSFFCKCVCALQEFNFW